MMIKENRILASKFKKSQDLRNQSELMMRDVKKLAIKEIKEYMEHYEITIQDLVEKRSPKKKVEKAAAPAPAKKRVVKPKYSSEDGTLTWSGRGLQPRWLRERLAAGKKIEDFEIKS